MAKTMNDVLSKTKEVSELLGKRVDDIAKVTAALNAREKNIAQREKELGITGKTTSATNFHNVDVQTDVVDSDEISNRLFALDYQGYAVISTEPHPDTQGKHVIRYTKKGGNN